MSNDEKVEDDDVDEFVMKSKEIVETFIQGIRGLCWFAKEILAELKKGGKELRGQLARYAKEHVYTAERKKVLDDMVEVEKQELVYGVKIVIDPIVKARKKALKALSNSCNYAQELGIQMVLMAVSSEDKLHIATEGLVEKFAVLQDVKKVSIPQFELLIRSGMIEEEARDAVAQKVVKSRDQARKECTNTLLKAIKMEKVVQSQDVGNVRVILKALAEKQLQFSKGEGEDVDIED
ncbi:hypothetical protein EV426DRAFT_710462 [Tirmania nivea]|nr:hypothetical protein EV426DRAFT_710462 [Tirmania nivea]